MKKAFIFSMLNGFYEYSIHIITAKSFNDACNKLIEKEKSCKINDFNYYPRLDIDDSNTLSYQNRNTQLFNKKDREILNLIGRNNRERKEFTRIATKYYDKLIDKMHNSSLIGISGNKYLVTKTSEWYDWLEINIDMPENYYFTDGHSG